MFSNIEYCQSQDESLTKERNWFIEIEPSTFILKGYSIQVGKYLTKDKKLKTSFYSLATDVPESIQKNIFSNTVSEDIVRVGLQLALNTRYQIEVLKGRETNPYIGVVTGWQYFNIKNPAKEDLRVDAFLLTPYIGAEIYFYKNMLYVSPQIRAVTYLSPKYSVADRIETINSVFIMPQVSLGVRF